MPRDPCVHVNDPRSRMKVQSLVHTLFMTVTCQKLGTLDSHSSFSELRATTSSSCGTAMMESPAHEENLWYECLCKFPK